VKNYLYAYIWGVNKCLGNKPIKFCLQSWGIIIYLRNKFDSMNNSENQSSEIDEEISKDIVKDLDKGKRSVLPVFTLNEMINFCSKIYTELGIGSYHSKDLIAQVHGVIYDSIKQKFSAAQSFGLLELKHGTGYKLTQSFLHIYKPLTPEEKKQSIIEALRYNEIYAKLIDDFNGHPLPSEQGLSARLIRNFQIKDYAASKAALIFISNLKDSGLVSSNNIVNIGVVPSQDLTDKNSSKKDFSIDTGKLDSTPEKEVGYIEIPVPLNGGKRAYIKIPEDYKPEDCERIAKFVEALK
jgi:hypothetical protein